jgi:hypothetical protein
LVVTVPVIKAFAHEGRALRVGDTVTVAPLVAAALAQAGRVSLSKGYRTAALREARPTPRRRRAYKRRDMVAE